jgi:Zn-dependent protease with chaperone function
MTQTLQAIAWTLIHFCWQAAVVAGLYRLVSAAVARRSSQTRYLVALTALLLMMAAAVGTFAWELRDGAGPAAFAGSGEENALQGPAFAHGAFPRSLEPGFAAAESAAKSLTLTEMLREMLPWIDGLWVLGVVVLSLRTLGGWMLIERLRRSATAEAPAAVRASFLRIAAAMGLRREVLLRVSSAIAGPVTVGVLRALVLLPLSAAASLSMEEMEVVLAHELAHVRRADFLWNLLQALAETLFFFHPAVWWVSARIRYERELCCDDIALEFCADPLVYAHALFRLEEQRSRQMQLAMALDGHQLPRTLRMRVARILGEPGMGTGMDVIRPRSLAAACAALMVLLLPVPQLLARLNPAVRVTPMKARAAVQPVLAVVSVQAAKPSPSVPKSAVAENSSPKAGESRAEEQDQDEEKADGAEQTGQTEQASEPQAAPSTPGKGSYIDRMRAAGYDVDLDKFIAMKIQNVTPEYAQAMSQLGFGKLSADDLIACKIQGVSPEVIAKFKQEGFEVKSVHDAISYRIFNLTPEFAAGMKAAGFDGLGSKEMLAMRVQGVTPEYARAIKEQYPGATADDVVKTKIFRIDAAFIASAKKHGFTNLSLDKLVQLRISGLLDDEK